jgi:hypothetical protein
VDWSNEQYVRLYIRDTKTWLKLRWEGQSLFMMLLRKVDRAGVLDDIDDPVGDLALITGLPEEHVKVGLERLLKPGGPVEINGKTLVIPNFIEANEAPKSDRLRAREYRERRKRDAMNTNRDEESREQTARHSASLLPVPNPKPVPNQNLERDLARSNSKDEEDQTKGTFADKKGTFAEEQDWPLKSPEANAVLAKIREYWPDYPYEQARVSAAKLQTAYGQKINVLEVIDAAWAGWDPGRTVHDRSGLHVYLASYCNTEAGKAPRASQGPQNGKGGVPHQAEASRPSLAVRLKRLNDAVLQGRQIEPHVLVDTWNEAAGDKVLVDGRLRWFVITDLNNAGLVQLSRTITDYPKIVDHSLPAEPRTPKELLEGDEAPDAEWVKEQMKELNAAIKGIK